MPGREGKSFVPREGLVGRVNEMLETIQKDLLARALRFREENTFEPSTYDEFVAAVDRGFARAYWCGSPGCEDRVKEETKATVRCVPFEQPGISGPCIVCGGQAEEVAIFGRAYYGRLNRGGAKGITRGRILEPPLFCSIMVTDLC